MKNKTHLFVLLFAFTQFVFSQINQEESSSQVIGYWDLNEKQSYTANYSKYRIKDQDTAYTMKCQYNVDISIIDSTSNSYTIEWFYKDYQVETDNELIKRLTGLSDNMKVLIKTDEFGAFQEVLNWEEIKDLVTKVKPILLKEFSSTPNLDKFIEQAFLPYTTKSGIESNVIKDIKQFYTFHGGKYILNEKYEGDLLTANNYNPDKPFDTKVEVSLDELNIDDDNYVIRSYQVVDSDQLTEATINYLNSLASTNGQPISKTDFPPLNNETWVATRIHGSTGWPIFSLFSKEVTADNTTSVEEIVLEIN